MTPHIFSATPSGYSAKLITVEADSNRGLPSFNIVGMANKSVNESKERVKSALINSGFQFPKKHLTINLAPADLQKSGTHLDLPIALASLLVSHQLPLSDTTGYLFTGELSLSGHLRPVSGIINITEIAKQQGFHTICLPLDNFQQANLISGIKILPFKTLRELFLHLTGLQPLSQVNLKSTTNTVVKNNETSVETSDFDQIHGQTFAKRALTIALAGHHNILLSGPPGTGKTLLAKSALSLLPPLSPKERISVTKLHSLNPHSKELNNQNIHIARPFRTPHHTSTLSSIIGGGPSALPGEISYAHKGILFLDELPEFPKHILEALRQPLEDRQVTISRTHHKFTYPADFMLIATMNPCPCGYFNDPFHPCTCTPNQILNYHKKLSGPLLDRIDLFVTVDRLKPAELNSIFNSSLKNNSPKQNLSTNFSTSNVVKNTITEAISHQKLRSSSLNYFNSSLTPKQIIKFVKLSQSAQNLLNNASNSLGLSSRSYFKIIKVAQTIADLESSPQIKDHHLAEALNYRQKSSV